MDKWNTLPEWVRWILCWPIILILTVAGGLITMAIASMALDRIWITKSLYEILFPALATLICGPILFFLVHMLVPRKQTWVTGFFVAMSTILGVMSGIRWYFEIAELAVPIADLLQDVLQTVTAVGVSWFWFFHFKNLNTDS